MPSSTSTQSLQPGCKPQPGFLDPLVLLDQAPVQAALILGPGVPQDSHARSSQPLSPLQVTLMSPRFSRVFELWAFPSRWSRRKKSYTGKSLEFQNPGPQKSQKLRPLGPLSHLHILGPRPSSREGRAELGFGVTQILGRLLDSRSLGLSLCKMRVIMGVPVGLVCRSNTRQPRERDSNCPRNAGSS